MKVMKVISELDEFQNYCFHIQKQSIHFTKRKRNAAFSLYLVGSTRGRCIEEHCWNLWVLPEFLVCDFTRHEVRNIFAPGPPAGDPVKVSNTASRVSPLKFTTSLQVFWKPKRLLKWLTLPLPDGQLQALEGVVVGVRVGLGLMVVVLGQVGVGQTLLGGQPSLRVQQ